MRSRLWRARSGSANPVARSAMTLGRRTAPRRAFCGPPRARSGLAAVEELERLDEELDLTDPAAPELDVGRRAARLDERPVDLPLHRADRRDDPSVEARPVDGLARQLHEARPHAEVAGRDARLDERLALPELGAVPVIVAVPVERQDDGAHPPLGPEAQVDAERGAPLRDLP